jgi:hypothetical protein
MKVLERANPKLGHFGPACMGIDVSGLLADARRIRQHLSQLGPERISEFDPALFPIIRLVTDDA